MDTDNAYKKITDLVVNYTREKSENIFDYSLSPHKDEFENIFDFYNENLKNHREYGVSPSVLYFNNKTSINAKACKDNNFYLISINMGTIVGLINLFLADNDYLLEKEFEEFEQNLDNPISVLMLQNAIHFTFYHELGHLIQMTENKTEYFYEHLDNTNGFSEQSHLNELDADEFSALALGAHILQYSEKIFGKDFSDEELEKIIIISCSSSLFYLLNFEANKRKLYFEEFSHPHPIIRIFSIVFTTLSYCINTLKLKGRECNLQATNIFNNTLDFTENLSKILFEEKDIDLISDFKNSFSAFSLEILDYLKKYQTLKDKDDTLSVNKRNKIIVAKSK